MMDFLRIARRKAACLGHGIGRTVGLSHVPKEPVCFICENADWAIRWVGHYIQKGVNSICPEQVALTSSPAMVDGRIVHFGSQYMWLAWGKHMSVNNQFVASFFHGKPEDGPDVARHIDAFVSNADRLSKIVVSATLVRPRLEKWGIDPAKIVQIPIGCDTDLFVPPTVRQRRQMRNEIGVPENAICIGSFQKDGVGWGDGMEPKMIKGPDVFIEVVKRLAKQINVFVLLTGPARGYVKAGLEENGIPYHHSFLRDYKDIARYFHALDLYLMASREEGGPKALMEAMSSHVPVVATRVGQAEDLIVDGSTGGLTEPDNIESLCAKSVSLLGRDPDEALEYNKAARDKVVQEFDWRIVARRHYEEVYLPLMGKVPGSAIELGEV